MSLEATANGCHHLLSCQVLLRRQLFWAVTSIAPSTVSGFVPIEHFLLEIITDFQALMHS